MIKPPFQHFPHLNASFRRTLNSHTTYHHPTGQQTPQPQSFHNHLHFSISPPHHCSTSPLHFPLFSSAPQTITAIFPPFFPDSTRNRQSLQPQNHSNLCPLPLPRLHHHNNQSSPLQPLLPPAPPPSSPFSSYCHRQYPQNHLHTPLFSHICLPLQPLISPRHSPSPLFLLLSYSTTAPPLHFLPFPS